jgi:hypothetical protein
VPAPSFERIVGYQQIEKEVKTQTQLTVGHMCQVAGVSRAGYYRAQTPPQSAPADLDVRHERHQIAWEWPSYGSRRIARELKDRSWKVNRKRVRRLMREDNLRCVIQRKFVIPTDSAHNLMVYPNRAAALKPTGVDQLWGADIPYLRLEEEFVYLAAILDAHSRRVIGWHLDETLAASLPLAALRMALEQRSARPGLVHQLRSRRAVRQQRVPTVAQGPFD